MFSTFLLQISSSFEEYVTQNMIIVALCFHNTVFVRTTMLDKIFISYVIAGIVSLRKFSNLTIFAEAFT